MGFPLCKHWDSSSCNLDGLELLQTLSTEGSKSHPVQPFSGAAPRCPWSRLMLGLGAVSVALQSVNRPAARKMPAWVYGSVAAVEDTVSTPPPPSHLTLLPLVKNAPNFHPLPWRLRIAPWGRRTMSSGVMIGLLRPRQPRQKLFSSVANLPQALCRAPELWACTLRFATWELPGLSWALVTSTTNVDSLEAVGCVGGWSCLHRLPRLSMDCVAETLPLGAPTTCSTKRALRQRVAGS